MSLTRYQPQALIVASKINTLLRRRRMHVAPAFELWEGARGVTWLSAVFDTEAIEAPERQAHYEDAALLHHLSTNLRGRPVILANHNGLRWCIPLSGMPKLPDRVALPADTDPARVALGVGISGPVVSTWDHEGGLGNVLIAAMKRQGKSTMLRALARQALTAGHQLIVADHQGLTFWGLRGHPQVLAYGDTVETAQGVLLGALQEEVTRRADYFRQGGIDKIETLHARGEKLPRLIVLVDEYYDLMQNSPQEVATSVHGAALSAPKYGVHLIIAGHYFDEKSVGKLKGQFETRICFRFMDAPAARILVGTDAPLRIRQPGRAMTNRWGLMQTYTADLDALGEEGLDDLSPREQVLMARLREEFGGKATHHALEQLGLKRAEIAEFRAWLVQRGLAKPDPKNGNALVLEKPA